MDHDGFSAIAHQHHRYLSPIGDDTMEELYGLLRLPPGARVLDLGCGKGESLVRLIELYGVHATGVERNRHFVAAARARAAEVPDADLELIETDISAIQLGEASAELGMCIGATHLCGGLGGTLRELHRLVVPGGHAVVGEGFWRKPTPDREYLEFLGASAGDLTSHRGNQELIEQAGWELLRAWSTSDEVWDAYEESYRDGVERHALDHPAHADVPAMLTRIRAWHHAYQFFGRFNLGFGLYLLRRR